jgi:Na+/H+-translocating membrane pyrophosphatase
VSTDEHDGPEPASVSGSPTQPIQAQPTHPIVDFTFADLTALLKRAVRITVVLGVAVTLFLWFAMAWQTAALFAVGGALSVGSIYEWGRLIRVFSARMDGQTTGASSGSRTSSGLRTGTVVFLFLVRLILFAVVIYVSLKCLHGSPIALLCGLGLGLTGLVWESMRVLRG